MKYNLHDHLDQNEDDSHDGYDEQGMRYYLIEIPAVGNVIPASFLAAAGVVAGQPGHHHDGRVGISDDNDGGDNDKDDNDEDDNNDNDVNEVDDNYGGGGDDNGDDNDNGVDLGGLAGPVGVDPPLDGVADVAGLNSQ